MKDFSWADPTSNNYRADVVELIHNVAENKAAKARSVWYIEVEQEDIVSELYAHLFAKPSLLVDNKFPSKNLHNVAADYCFKQRKDQGAAAIGTDALHEILTDWNTIPQYILNIMYGPVFAKAGKPSGGYLKALEEAYRDKDYSGYRLTVPRALKRLAEVLSGIMVGTPDSLQRLGDDKGIPTYSDPDYDDETEYDEDDTFNPLSAIYMCDAGHEYKYELGCDKAPNKLGQVKIYGYRFCKCGLTLELRKDVQ